MVHLAPKTCTQSAHMGQISVREMDHAACEGKIWGPGRWPPRLQNRAEPLTIYSALIAPTASAAPDPVLREELKILASPKLS